MFITNLSFTQENDNGTFINDGSKTGGVILGSSLLNIKNVPQLMFPKRTVKCQMETESVTEIKEIETSERICNMINA